MKGTPDAPQCGFSMAVSNILKHLNVKFEGVNVLVSDELRQGIKDFTDCQLFHSFMSKENLLEDVTLSRKCLKKVNLKNFLRKNPYYLE